MRNAFCQAMVGAARRDDFVFLTGDLGFNALEPLQKAAGNRFLNAGVAEQNMVSVAAGLARRGFQPWVYSIAPFLYARPLEQVRNDLSLHDLPVKLAGNGGGYGYGVMGGSHHALEDYGILLSLLNVRVFIPAFASDIPPMVDKLLALPHPAYLRLGRDEKPKDLAIPAYSPWRKILDGDKGVLVLVGPLAGPYLGSLASLPKGQRPSAWVLSELPLEAKGWPGGFPEELGRTGHLLVAEEHLSHGSAGEALCRKLMLEGLAPKRFTHFCAQGYPSGLYGSQGFHRKESGLTVENLLKELNP